MGYFYSDLAEDEDTSLPDRLTSNQGGAMDDQQLTPRNRRETLELVRAYWMIENKTVRRCVCHVTRTLAGSYKQNPDRDVE